MNTEKRWMVLYVLCLATLMIVLDTTIVNVALPSIRESLGFSETNLAWVVNAYALTFAGFLLLGGRLGDLYGQRRFFVLGIGLFTLASFVCGISTSQGMLIAARAIQGLGGAVASAVALGLTMNLFPEPDERAKAMGVFGFVAAGGGSIGVLLGGILTGSLNWHWIFLVNVPIGIIVAILTYILLHESHNKNAAPHLDTLGAILVTGSLLCAVYAIVNGNSAGWMSFQTVGLLISSAILMALFIRTESRVRAPLVPLNLFRIRNFTAANAIGILWSGAMFTWFFLSALYLQLVLHYDPLHVGLAFLPANIIMGIFSLGLSARLVLRFGIKQMLTIGMLFVASGLALFARAPLDGNFWIDIFPNMVLLGLGVGIAFNPVLLGAMNDVPQNESGLASGIVNTAFMMGGALGLAILASISAFETAHLLQNGTEELQALLSGYHLAFIVGATFALCAAGLAWFVLRIKNVPATPLAH